jgi:hypothetical protein
MKNLTLKALTLGGEILTRKQLKSVMGGNMPAPGCKECPNECSNDDDCDGEMVCKNGQNCMGVSPTCMYNACAGNL